MLSELSKQFSISSSTLSHHIRELKLAGLIETIRVGKHLKVLVRSGETLDLLDFAKEVGRHGTC